MKKLLTTAALSAALFAASPAHAEDKIDRHAFGIALVIIYDAGCQKLPITISGPLAAEMPNIPKATFIPAITAVQEWLKRDGPVEFCASAKREIEQAVVDTLRRIEER